MKRFDVDQDFLLATQDQSLMSPKECLAMEKIRKFQIVKTILLRISNQKLSSAQIAQRLGMSQKSLNALMEGKFMHYSEEQLRQFLFFL
ncbi:MAG: XRE family transcriptional regulator [Betaproteobacteria bacterium]|jgi:predicted XRE-type DNA-binding protein